MCFLFDGAILSCDSHQLLDQSVGFDNVVVSFYLHTYLSTCLSSSAMSDWSSFGENVGCIRIVIFQYDLLLEVTQSNHLSTLLSRWVLVDLS